MDVQEITVTEEDIALVAQYALAEAHNSNNMAFFENAMEVAGGLTNGVERGITTNDLQQLAWEAEQHGMKTAEDIRSLAAWMMFT